MSRRRRTCSVLAALVLLGGCTASGEPTTGDTTTGDVSESGTPSKPVAVDDVVVDVAPPVEPMVLDSVPASFDVRRVSAGPIEEVSPSFDPLTNSATLYADPAIADPLDGPVLLVGTSAGSASIGGPDLTVPGARPVDINIGYGAATLVPAGDRTWVVVPTPYEDHVAYVIGRGIDEDELLAAARGADYLGAPPTLAGGTVPQGLVPVVAGSPGDGPVTWQGEQIELMVDEVLVRVSVVRADPRLAQLWGFWAADAGEPVGARGSRAGPMPGTNQGGPDAYGVVWAEHGNVVSVVGSDFSMSPRGPDLVGVAVEEVAALLRPGTSAELTALGEIVLEPPTAAEIWCPADAPMLTGRTGDVRWAYAAAPDPEWDSPLHQCSALVNPVDGLQAQDGITHAGEELPSVGRVIAGTPNSNVTLDRPQHTGILKTGIAPPGTVRVVVTAPDLSNHEAALGAAGPRPGELLFAAYVPGEWYSTLPARAFTAAAFDAAGVMIEDTVLP